MDYKITENIIEITWIIKEYSLKGDIRCIPFYELKEFIETLAERFEQAYGNSDFTDQDYNEEISKYTKKELAKELWSRFGDVLMNPETECIENEWNGFPAGSHREEIWHWFEKTFGVSITEDLMGL